MKPDPIEILRKIERELQKARESGSHINLQVAAAYAVGVAKDTIAAHTEPRQGTEP